MTKEKKAKGRPMGHDSSLYDKAKKDLAYFGVPKEERPHIPALMRSARCSSGMRFGVLK